jgi:hypothetical protein
VATFENALVQSCRCRADCDASWTDQFGNTSRACLAEILRDLDLVECVAVGSSEISKCLLAKDCNNFEPSSCETALLTEDTPLMELVEYYCRGRGPDYRDALRAADWCRK